MREEFTEEKIAVKGNMREERKEMRSPTGFYFISIALVENFSTTSAPLSMNQFAATAGRNGKLQL